MGHFKVPAEFLKYAASVGQFGCITNWFKDCNGSSSPAGKQSSDIGYSGVESSSRDKHIGSVCIGSSPSTIK